MYSNKEIMEAPSNKTKIIYKYLSFLNKWILHLAVTFIYILLGLKNYLLS